MKVYIYWDSGQITTPLVVEHCIRRWRAVFGDDVEVVVKAKADKIVSAHVGAHERLEPQVYADILRLALLYKTGGVWADATVLPGFDRAAIEDLIRPEGKVKVFNAPGGKRPCANWLISAPAQNRLIGGWLEFYAEYWAQDRDPIKTAPVHQRFLLKVINTIEPNLLMSPTYRSLFEYFPYFACHYSLRYMIKKDNSLLNELKIMHYNYISVADLLRSGDLASLPLLTKLSWRDKETERLLLGSRLI